MSLPVRKNWVVVEFGSTVLEPMARELSRHQRLRRFITVRKRKPAWDRGETVCLRSLHYLYRACSRVAGTERQREIVRNFGNFPLDRIAAALLEPSDHILSSNHFALAAFRKVKQAGGKCIYDSGNAHTAEHRRLWDEEYARWKPECANLPAFCFERSLAMIELSDLITYPAAYVRQTYLDRGWPGERLVHLPYEIDLSHFRPGPLRTGGEFKVVCTGTPCLRKGFAYLLTAFARFHQEVPQARLVISKPVLDVAHLIPRHLPFIEWQTYLPLERLAARYHSADVFILPSIEEGSARTVVEAMACALPIITTSQTTDLLTDRESALIVPRADSDAIYQALRWIYGHPAEAKLMGENARRRASQVRREAFNERMAELMPTVFS